VGVDRPRLEEHINRDEKGRRKGRRKVKAKGKGVDPEEDQENGIKVVLSTIRLRH
jgi:hypothetical protein